MSANSAPAHVRFRDQEWAKLIRFARHDNGALRIGVVSGRRRLGKSHLLRALCEQMGGIYLLAVQEDSRPAAQARVTEAIARARGVPAEALRLGDDWAAILRLLLQPLPTTRHTPPLLVLDEFPYLLRHSPELPGLLQSLYDEARYESEAGRETLHGGVILCGSALSVMDRLLSGQQALRGRATLDLRVPPLNHRAARRFWRIDDLHTAFLVDAVCGGVPGYQVLAEQDSPQSLTEFDAFAVDALLTPGHPLYSRTETEYLLREDPRLDQRAVYYPLLSAMVGGATTPSEIGARIGKERSATAHALTVLEAAGYALLDEDLLKKRSPSYLVPDPMIRFNQAVTVPQTPLCFSRSCKRAAGLQARHACVPLSKA
ncbi:ATP-binding protein [Streptomyces sp. NPDC020917]|uniref:ATP-binding protein n=1 Tax=Streptomyces sp. NPDC020917 TaxID=3365102 RepID=UPI003793DE52